MKERIKTRIQVAIQSGIQSVAQSVARRAGYLLSVTLLGALLAPMLSGCGGEQEIALPGPDQKVPLQVAASNIETEIETRAGSVTSGSMGVFRTTANGYPAQYNAQYTYSSGWTPKDNANTVFLDGRAATLCAYYPVGSVTFSSNSFTATLTAQSYDANKDMQYAKTGGSGVTNLKPTASFAMAQAYSRVKLSIKRELAGTSNVSKVNLKNGTTFYASRTIDISNGTLGGSTTNGGWNYTFSKAISNSSNTDYDVLVPPQPVSNGLTITLTIDGVDCAVTVPTARFSSGNLDPGKQYSISLVIKDSAVSISGNINITDYTADGTSIKNDTPKEL